MTNTPLSVLIERTYSRADLAYRIGLLREFLGFAFFTRHEKNVTKETLEAFEQKNHAEVDIEFLRSLPVTFFDAFTQESFYSVLDDLAKESQQLPTITLTVPVVLDASSKEALGVWVRKEIGEEVLLDLSTDATLATGCQIVWGNTLHDFGFDRALEQKRAEVEKHIEERVIASPVATV